MSAADDTLRAAGLLTLGADPPREAVEAALRRLGDLAKDADDLRLEALRAGASQILRKIPGWRTSVLDSVLAKPKDTASGGLQGQDLDLYEPEPWHDPVDGEALLDEIRETAARYVVLPAGAPEAFALWAIHAHAHDASDVSPFLAFCAPTMRCGKSTALRCIGALVPRPQSMSNITAAALFRIIEKCGPTLLIDEADTYIEGNGDAFRGILNGGHTRSGAFVIRTVGDDYEPRRFSTWAPKAVAKIGNLPPTLADRSIVVQLKRRLKDEHVTRFPIEGNPPEFEPLCRKIARWVADHMNELRSADPKMPSDLHDRAADNWRPLIAIADAAGGRWAEAARRAARVLSGAADEDDEDSVLLLNDIREMFTDGVDKLKSTDIADALGQMKDRPWAEWKGQPITELGVSKLLKHFDIRPKVQRFGDITKRGYLRSDFEDAWKRYPSTSAPSQTRNTRNNPSVGRVSDTSDTRNTNLGVTPSESGEKPCGVRDVAGVTGTNPVLGNGTKASSVSSVPSASERPYLSPDILASIQASWKHMSARS